MSDALEAHEAELEFDRAATGLDIEPKYPLDERVVASLLVHLRDENDGPRRMHLVEMVSKHVAALRRERDGARIEAKMARGDLSDAREAARNLCDALGMES